jgi:hypothetical protein
MNTWRKHFPEFEYVLGGVSPRAVEELPRFADSLKLCCSSKYRINFIRCKLMCSDLLCNGVEIKQIRRSSRVELIVDELVDEWARH